jgi:hypothetical protein
MKAESIHLNKTEPALYWGWLYTALTAYEWRMSLVAVTPVFIAMGGVLYAALIAYLNAYCGLSILQIIAYRQQAKGIRNELDPPPYAFILLPVEGVLSDVLNPYEAALANESGAPRPRFSPFLLFLRKSLHTDERFFTQKTARSGEQGIHSTRTIAKCGDLVRWSVANQRSSSFPGLVQAARSIPTMFRAAYGLHLAQTGLETI